MANEKNVQYKVSNIYIGKDLLTIRDHQHVNITGSEIKATRKGSKGSVPQQYTYRAGTEDDRKWFYEQKIIRDADGKVIPDANGNEISNQKAIIKVSNDNTTVTKSDK